MLDPFCAASFASVANTTADPRTKQKHVCLTLEANSNPQDSLHPARPALNHGLRIHTHMCYAEFGDILQAIDDLDADVISLEAARSHMQVAGELATAGYPREVGPGVYDIHSPRVPSTEEAAALLRKGLEAIAPERLWVNPDCGLKTRGWPEVRVSLENLVSAAREVRSAL